MTFQRLLTQYQPIEDQPAKRRRAILEHVQANPGVSLRALARATGIGLGSLQHHVRMLVKRNRLWMDCLGKTHAYHAGPQPACQQDVLKARMRALDELDRRLMSLIDAADAPTQVAILTAFSDRGLARSTVQSRLKRLTRRGLLRAEPRGRLVVYAVVA